MNNIGKKIAQLRKEKGLKQIELAEKSGVKMTTLSKMEVGQIKNPSIANIVKIAKALDITVDDLLNSSLKNSD